MLQYYSDHKSFEPKWKDLNGYSIIQRAYNDLHWVGGEGGSGRRKWARTGTAFSQFRLNDVIHDVLFIFWNLFLVTHPRLMLWSWGYIINFFFKHKPMMLIIGIEFSGLDSLSILIHIEHSITSECQFIFYHWAGLKTAIIVKKIIQVRKYPPHPPPSPLQKCE